MKKIIISFLTITLLLTGCAGSNKNDIKEMEVENLKFSGIDYPTLISYIEDDL